MRLIIPVSLLGLALAACDEPKPRGPVPPEGLPPPGPRAAAAKVKAEMQAPPGAAAFPVDADGATRVDLPPPPGWAKDLIGQPLDAAFPARSNACIGNTDVVTVRFKGRRQGVRVLGWAWDPTAKAPLKRTLVADSAGRVVAGGETGTPRRDVTAVRTDVTSPDTGWLADIPLTKGEVTGWAILADGKTLCPLGHLSL